MSFVTFGLLLFLAIAGTSAAAFVPYLGSGYMESLKNPTISHFTEHGLCKSVDGYRKLYNALKVYMCHLPEGLIKDVVLDMCKRQDDMVVRWIKEIFDTDGDGYISHFEKEFYEKKNFSISSMLQLKKAMMSRLPKTNVRPTF